MSPVAKLLVAGAVATVTFDALMALVSRRFGVPYGAASIGSWLIYAIIGYIAASAAGVSVQQSAVAGAVMGLVDATIGWAISWAIGPGRVSGGLTVTRWLATAVFVVVTAAVFGALGGALARREGGALSASGQSLGNAEGTTPPVLGGTRADDATPR
jgi:hypothetical protein